MYWSLVTIQNICVTFLYARTEWRFHGHTESHIQNISIFECNHLAAVLVFCPALIYACYVRTFCEWLRCGCDLKRIVSARTLLGVCCTKAYKNHTLILLDIFYYLRYYIYLRQWKMSSEIMVHSCQQKSIGLKFSKSQTGSDVRYSCHHTRNSSRFTFPIFAHSCRFSVLHSLQSITPRIY